MLIWQDPEGTHVGYLDPRELADRYAFEDPSGNRLEVLRPA
jgi:hypothetical protein